MKKILSISVIAAMAALPMAARADYTPIAISESNPNDAAVMATAKYVKGAYNSLRAEKQDKLSETQMAAVDSGITAAKLTALESAMGASGKSVATQIKEGAEGADFTAGEGTGFTAGTDTINEALKDLDGRVTTNAGDIDSLETAIGDDNTANSVKGRIAALETTVDTATTGLSDRMTAAEGDIDTLEGSLGHASDAQNNVQASGLYAQVEALEGKVGDANLSNYTTTSALQTTYATKAGVDATLATVAQGAVTNGAISGEISTTGGSFTYVTDWSTGATDTVSFLTAANKGTIASNVSVAAPTFSTYAVANQ